MAQLKRTGASAPIPGVGYVHNGVIHTVPDDMVDDLLATGEWEALHAAPVERVTEPAPAKPAAKPRTRKTVKK